VINAFAGVQSVTAEQHELAALLRLNRLQMMRRIQLRMALPSIFTGLKVAVTLAVIGAVVAEFVAADKGLGYLLVVTQASLATSLMFAAVVVLTVFGAVLYGAVALLERLMIPWHISQRRK
jgi:NitT/TauT family transport system permease protein